MKPGVFLTLEGPEGGGKSTQAARLIARLEARGIFIVRTREPGGTPTGELLRDILQHDRAGEPVAPETEVLLFAASRAQHMRRVILPGVLGHVLTGVRLSIGILWIVLVPCEMLGVSAGLGYFILDTRDRLAYSELMAAIVLIGALGWLLDAATRKLHSRWVH